MKFNRLTIVLFVALAALVLGWHSILLWLSGLDRVRIPDIALTAVYDFTPQGKSAPQEERTLRSNGKGMLSLSGPTFSLIEDFPGKRKMLVQPEHKSFYEIEFLQQTPSVHFFQPSYVQLWETRPLGAKNIDGLDCVGFEQNGLHKHTPLDTFFNAIGMRVDAIGRKNDQLWFDKGGVLVEGYGLKRKSLTLGAPSAEAFVVPEGYRKMFLP